MSVVSPQTLERVARRLYGDSPSTDELIQPWEQRLARGLNVYPRTVRKLLNGQMTFDVERVLPGVKDDELRSALLATLKDED